MLKIRKGRSLTTKIILFHRISQSWTCSTSWHIFTLFVHFWQHSFLFNAGLHRNANTNAACENDAYVHVGKFVDCSAFAKTANWPYNSLWCTDSRRIVFACLPNVCHSRMLFASPQEYVYIERSHRFCMPHSRSVRILIWTRLYDFVCFLWVIFMVSFHTCVYGFENPPWKLWCARCICNNFKHLFTLFLSDIFNVQMRLKIPIKFN